MVFKIPHTTGVITSVMIILLAGLTLFPDVTRASSGISPLSSVTIPREEFVLEQEPYEKIRTMADEGNPLSEISITTIKTRSVVTTLEVVSGTSKKPGQSIWFFLVNNERKVFFLGNTTSNNEKKFTLLSNPNTENLSGELFLFSSLVSDIRLSINLPQANNVMAFYKDSADDSRSTENDQKPTMLIEKTEFLSAGKPLQTLQSRYLEIYAEDNKSLQVNIRGRVYGATGKTLQLSSVLLPAIIQESHDFLEGDEKRFDITVQASDLSWDEEYQILLIASDSTENILEARENALSTNQVISFRLRSENDYPRSIMMFLQANRQPVIFALLVFMILSFFLIHRTFSQQSRWAKALSILLLSLQISVTSYLALSNTLQVLYNNGFIKIPGQEMIVHKKTSEENMESVSLVKLNENLEIIPNLSTSWSNISPHIWEFVLRENISAEWIILELNKKMKTGASDRRYMSTLKSIVGISPNKLQFITQFPDPLLPQKLSKITINPSISGAGTSRQYEVIESFPSGSRYELNQDYFDLPFLKHSPAYINYIKAENGESIKELISSQKIDVFDDPDTKLWPALLQNNYRILPKINTESLMVLTNRQSFFLKDPEMILALRKILMSPQVLQTSYFQYGQLASQFTPPGVVGYSPELKIPSESRPVEEILETVRKNLKTNELTLTLQYPAQEKIVAKVMIQEMERAGIRVIDQEIESNDYERVLSEKTADLNLLPLDFDMGDAGPFLDALIDSESPYNNTYLNPEADELIRRSRTELNHSKRIQLLQKIMNIIVIDHPAGIPLLFKKSFIAQKKPPQTTWWERWLQREILGWK